MKRFSKFKLNNLTSVALQLTSVVSGILLPRMILGAFGSEVNGLISSISQFLSYITLMEAGVGAVAKSAMFGPLANKDAQALSAVVNSCQKFFRFIALVFLGYMMLVAVGYPLIKKDSGFEYDFVFTLVLILSIGSFTQYYFGLTNQLLLQADQKLYIVNGLQILSVGLNLLVCLTLILLDANIHMVKLVSSIVLLLRPMGIYFYVKRKYRLDKKVESDLGALKQRWDGLAHHLAFFVHKNTDIVLLTLFSSYGEVSVYAVYNLITSSIQGIISSLSNSVTAKFGQLYAKNERENLHILFGRYETFIFVLASILFSVTAVMIVPFVRVYTKGVTDVEYIRPVFAAVLVFAEFLYVVREPYNNVVFAAGKFKHTKKGAIIEAVCNVVVSLLLVNLLGIVGVAVGTLIAMFYRTANLAVYLSKNLINRSIKVFVKNLLIASSGYGISVVVCKCAILNNFEIANFVAWALCACVVAVVCGVINIVLHILVNRKAFFEALRFFSY